MHGENLVKNKAQKDFYDKMSYVQNEPLKSQLVFLNNGQRISPLLVPNQAVFDENVQ